MYDTCMGCCQTDDDKNNGEMINESMYDRPCIDMTEINIFQHFQQILKTYTIFSHLLYRKTECLYDTRAGLHVCNYIYFLFTEEDIETDLEWNKYKLSAHICRRRVQANNGEGRVKYDNGRQ